MEEGKQKNYHKALVIFIDILGSKSKKSFEELYEINDTFHSQLLENEKNNLSHVVYQRKIFTFSDCAYIIYDFKDGVEEERKKLGALFEVALCNCEQLFIKFLNKNFIFRGGVSYGDVYYESNRNLLFGPAINCAYQLESSVAIYPRIAVEPYVAEKLLEHWYKVVAEMENPKTETEKQIYTLLGNPKIMQGCIIKKDFDGVYMVNYLNSIEINVDNISLIHKTNAEFIDSFIMYCKEQIESNESKPNIVQKYNWLLNYMNSVTQ